jgi:hypothetical protein
MDILWERGIFFIVPPSSRVLKFTAEIQLLGINPYVDIPDEIREAVGRKGNLPVKGTVNDHPFRSTLVPVRGGPHRLYINMEMRKGTGVGVGDTVEILLEYDPDPRPEPVPEPLTRALEQDGEAKSAWEALNPSRRREILRYLNSLKSPEAIQRNVEKVLKKIKGK